ncbi:Kdo hydroxylase family protein [Pararobbsia silviterrae]|uniref:3-deoxy-D-manno-oct-2-ulosonic acid (Kdo) hydroxylase n=1 Tax=Pararobbsia silviterrae TaxID=1792498 RepID=A0A494YFF5_9BURK|nr:Kdo hydroxylase family protein [Pararobbsia silviterrae]RKP59093.1 3-deoxy-D-manno-oct-2-ulosonic acid (Kdo) hydroxylase [Pararobbsia silviterrae]
MSDSQIIEVRGSDWRAEALDVPRETLRAGLERGKVLFFPSLAFEVSADERRLFDPSIADPKRKNISLAPRGGALVGVVGDEATQTAVRAMVARFQRQAHELVDRLLPEYRGKMRSAPTSLRLHQVETRHSSWRKDDSRLHIDAFPSRPNRGERILRVFVNVNPTGAPRVWRVGEPFETVARRFVPAIKPALPGSAWLLETLGITKSRRTEYDHLMLHLHDAMKADLDYQRDAAQQTMPFPAGSTWVCFSDQTSHAVMSGQFMMEQTLFLAARDMVEPDCAPLAVLERVKGHALV